MEQLQAISSALRSASARTALCARVITTLEEWQVLASSWDELLNRSCDSTPWQSFSYLTNWWKHLATNRSLFVVVIEQANKPCLVLPLQVSTVRMLGLRVRALEPIGMWSDVNRPRLALGADDDTHYQCAFDVLWQHRHRWDVLRLDEKLLDDAEVLRIQRFCQQHGLMFRSIFSHLCPYLDLRQTWNMFLSQRSSKLAKNLRAARRKLESMGTVTVRDCRGVEEVARGFDVVLSLHQHSWKRHKRVEHTSANYRQFFRHWLLDMARNGQARILLLYCDARPVAATIAFNLGLTYFSSQIVHDESFAHCSPGTLLESIELEGLMTEKRYMRYDFLGSFLNNKLRWTDTAYSTSVVYGLQDGLKNRLIAFYYFSAKPYLKHQLARLNAHLVQRTSA